MRVPYSTSIAVALSIFLLAVGIAQGRREKIHLSGRIIAYRPVDSVVQTASLVLNKEVFLFMPNSVKRKSGPVVIKLVYQHFGYSDLGQDILDKTPTLRVTAKREPACDESYESFVSNAARLKNETSQVHGEGVVFIGRFRGTQILPTETLKCYTMQKGEFRIETPAP